MLGGGRSQRGRGSAGEAGGGRGVEAKRPKTRQLDQYGRTPTPVADVDIMALLPGDYKSFRYAGSLTTPVCGQGVQWNVLKTPIKASAEQIAKFAKLFAPAGNARPLQPLNGRTVERDFQ